MKDEAMKKIRSAEDQALLDRLAAMTEEEIASPDAVYTRTLVDLGHRDAHARIAELEAFLRRAPPLAARPGGRPAQTARPGRVAGRSHLSPPTH